MKWSTKKREKWKIVPGSGLANYFYLAPGVKKKDAILGFNMFDSAESVVEYWNYSSQFDHDN